ncbi:hypothetical protein HBNCFIEN_03267 [Legionella sp. PC997]|nr:hypothetical protein HBNCFIEN_03267 [Legionella sp. PC997]
MLKGLVNPVKGLQSYATIKSLKSCGCLKKGQLIFGCMERVQKDPLLMNNLGFTVRSAQNLRFFKHLSFCSRARLHN